MSDAQGGLDRQLEEALGAAEVAGVGLVVRQRDLGQVAQDSYVAGQRGEQLVYAVLVNHG